MIYSVNKSFVTENADIFDNIIDEEFYKYSTKDRNPITEDAYIFLYESDYNFNLMIKKINENEIKAEEMGCVLVLEAADIKEFFRKIGRAIAAAWERFKTFIINLKNKIVNIFTKHKKIKTDFSDSEMQVKFETWKNDSSNKSNDVKSDFDDIKQQTSDNIKNRHAKAAEEISKSLNTIFNNDDKVETIDVDTSMISDASNDDPIVYDINEDLLDETSKILNELMNDINDSMDNIGKIAEDIRNSDNQETLEKSGAILDELLDALEWGVINESKNEITPNSLEEKLGLNKKVRAKEKYKSYNDLKNVDGNKTTRIIDKISSIASDATKKAINMLNKEASSVDKDSEAYRLKIKVANCYRKIANKALTISTALSKALYIDTNQKVRIINRIAMVYNK